MSVPHIKTHLFILKSGGIHSFLHLVAFCCCCCCQVTSVVSNSVQPHRWQPTRLPRLWDSPGKKAEVGCHFLLQCVKVKRESEVAQSPLTPSDAMDCSPPGSSIHGIFQTRVLEWLAIAFSIFPYSCLIIQEKVGNPITAGKLVNKRVSVRKKNVNKYQFCTLRNRIAF